ncbi:MAG: hypothetical protein JWN60_8 [Acidobacteria bacterium]|jgi:hypothetical protein|nr:hypothetical protein [Acidobacteriota bacterium]
MEILIIGGALVALMVYVSTKVKKSAESAYERELFETEKFSIIKPENFINPLNENSEYVFTAYSKDFGKADAEELRQAQVNLRVYTNADFEEICRNAKLTAEKIISEERSKKEDEKLYFVSGEKSANGIQIETLYTIMESRKRPEIYELEISILSYCKESYSNAVNELLGSFTLK